MPNPDYCYKPNNSAFILPKVKWPDSHDMVRDSQIETHSSCFQAKKHDFSFLILLELSRSRIFALNVHSAIKFHKSNSFLPQVTPCEIQCARPLTYDDDLVALRFGIIEELFDVFHHFGEFG